tara:strand:+ start:20933 stop:21124 length:192 start_codon:yes stop_codon:yes gene_type:complete
VKKYILTRQGRSIIFTQKELEEAISEPNSFIKGYYPEDYYIYELKEENRVTISVTKTYKIKES